MFSDTAVVTCGREIKYGKFSMDDGNQEIEWTRLAIDFEEKTEIHKVWSTSEYGHI
jgi:hypothetical protein